MGKRHGKEGTQVYWAWDHIKRRCCDPKSPGYRNYGARGISIHPAWNDFSTFYAAVGDPPTNKHSIDRIDNDRGYEPGNVRWATRTQQNRNTRRNTAVTFNGKTKTVAEWAEELKVPYRHLYNQLKREPANITDVTVRSFVAEAVR